VGCYEFRQPLGPVDEAFIDSRLVGAWSCVSPEEARPLVLTIMDFDGKQYYMHFADDQEKQEHWRAHATRVGDRVFLSVITIEGERSEPDWTFLEYTLAESGLRLRIVYPRPFEDVREDPQQVRDLLEQHLDDPEVFVDGFACTKAGAADPGDGPG
jgi:hypothetical protein